MDVKNLYSHLPFPGWYDPAFRNMRALSRPRTDEEKATVRLMKIGRKECKKGGNYSITRRANTPSGTKQEGDKLLPPLFTPGVQSTPLLLDFFFPPLNLLTGLISATRSEESKEVGEEDVGQKKKRQTKQTDGVGQRQSICAPCPGKGRQKKREEKGAGVGRLRVPSRDREQKGEGCGPDQVGAA